MKLRVKALLAAAAGTTMLAAPASADPTGDTALESPAPVPEKIRVQFQSIEVIKDGDAGEECAEADIRAYVAGQVVWLRTRINPTCSGDVYPGPPGSTLTLERVAGEEVTSSMAATEFDVGGSITQFGRGLDDPWVLPADGEQAYHTLDGYLYLAGGAAEGEKIRVRISVRLLNPVG